MRRLPPSGLFLGPGARPARSANLARNLLGDDTRRDRWRGARNRLGELLEPLTPEGGRVAVLGAGNAHDLPLGRLAERAGEVVLLDIDRRAPARARARLPRQLRRRVNVIEHDVTGGAADAMIDAAARGEVPDRVVVPESPLPASPYELVVGDLLYSQLVYPALVDLRVPEPRMRCFMDGYAPVLVRGVVARLHASTPHGTVVHLHDPLGWWAGHGQPVTLEAILDVSHRDVGAALRLVARGRGPRASDPRAALAHFGLPTARTTLWRWPFAEGTDYLVCATVARGDAAA